MHRGIISVCVAVACLAGSASPGRGAMQFTRNTDTIAVTGNTVLSDRATYEATVTFTSTSYPIRGFIYNAWVSGSQDEQFAILNGGALSAYGYPLGGGALNGGVLAAGVQYDLAYVYDGSQERLYINGNLAASRAMTGTIASGTGNTSAVGAIFRDGAINVSFLGSIQSLRISNSARYSGNSYSPNFGDFTDDTSTLLLYDFDTAPVNGVIPDLSTTGHNGTLGAGFTGATSPTFVLPDPAGLSVMGLAAGICLMRRRRRAIA